MQMTTRGIRRRIAVIGAKDKGGAGLSTTETALATVLRATGEGHFRVQIVDADKANGSLTQRLGERDDSGKLLAEQDPYKGIIKADLFDRDGARPIFHAIESDAEFVIIDTPSGSLDRFGSLSESLTARDLVDHIRHNDREPIVLVPFGPTVAAIRGVGKAIDTFGEVSYVGARYMAGVRDDDYRLWSSDPLINFYGRTVGGNVRRKFEEAGGQVIDMPPAPMRPFALAEALSLTFAQSATHVGGDYEQYDRLNMASWLNKWVREFQKIEDLLGLEGIEWRPF
jgi:hypothetical protein